MCDPGLLLRDATSPLRTSSGFPNLDMTLTTVGNVTPVGQNKQKTKTHLVHGMVDLCKIHRALHSPSPTHALQIQSAYILIVPM